MKIIVAEAPSLGQSDPDLRNDYPHREGPTRIIRRRKNDPEVNL